MNLGLSCESRRQQRRETPKSLPQCRPQNMRGLTRRRTGSRAGACRRQLGGGKVEQALDRVGHLLLLALFWKFLEFAGQRTGNLAGNAACHVAEQSVFIFGEGPALFFKRLQFLPAKLIQAATEGD